MEFKFDGSKTAKKIKEKKHVADSTTNMILDCWGTCIIFVEKVGVYPASVELNQTHFFSAEKIKTFEFCWNAHNTQKIVPDDRNTKLFVRKELKSK